MLDCFGELDCAMDGRRGRFDPWQSVAMDPAEQNLVEALLHHINIIFSSDAPDNVGRENELDNIKSCSTIAEKIVRGTASDDDKTTAAGLLHPQVRNTYGL